MWLLLLVIVYICLKFRSAYVVLATQATTYTGLSVVAACLLLPALLHIQQILYEQTREPSNPDMLQAKAVKPAKA